MVVQPLPVTGRTLAGRGITPGRCRGLALVSEMPLSFLGGVDSSSGVVVEKNHDLRGESLKDKILCFPYGHGSTVGSYILYSLVKRGLGPKAIVNQLADTVVIVGTIIADIPMVDQIDVRQIRTGDIVEVDGNEGTVKIEAKAN
jgi:predicted aconitase with swiveling domain